MSLKENINYIKEEVSAQESFMEKFFHIEKFYKKYKITIIGVIVILLMVFIGNSVIQYQSEKNNLKANEIFNNLINNPTNKQGLDELKEIDNKLYKLALYMQDKTKATDIQFFKELSLYSNAIKENNIDKISSVIHNQNFLLKDFAIFNKALIQAQNGKYKDAKESLKLISSKSSILNLSKMLEHFLITK